MVPNDLVLSLREEVIEFIADPDDLTEFFDVWGYCLPHVARTCPLSLLIVRQVNLIIQDILLNDKFLSLTERACCDEWDDELKVGFSRWNNKNYVKGRSRVDPDEMRSTIIISRIPEYI